MTKSFTPSDLATAYAARTAALRESTRWLLAAAAGVGAILVAGLQLTTLGSLGTDEWPRLLAAAAGLSAALLAVGYIIWEAGVLLNEPWTTLAELQVEDFENRLAGAPHGTVDIKRREQMDLIRGQLVVVADETYGSVANDIDDLAKRLAEANKAARAGGSSDEVAPLLAAANTVVQFANFQRTRSQFDWLRQRLAWASVAAAVGVLVYAYAANPPVETTKDPKASIIAVTGGSQSGLWLSSRPVPGTTTARVFRFAPER